MKKKIILSLCCLGLFLCSVSVQAQSARNSTGKDEFWGTSKVTTRGASADAVGAREAGLDKRLNTYETGKKRNFKITRYNNNKLKEMEKKEKKMLKKYRREKRRLERRRY